MIGCEIDQLPPKTTNSFIETVNSLRRCFSFQFCDVAQVAQLSVSIFSLGDIQKMKVENVEHQFLL